MPKPEFVDFDGDFRVNMCRKVESEFGVNGVTTQGTSQAELSEDDKVVLMLSVGDPHITQKEMLRYTNP